MQKSQARKDASHPWAKELKVALIHDFLLYPGGAERVLEVLAEMFPEAPIYTLLYDPEKMRGKFSGKDIRVSYLQKFPKFLRKRYQWLLPLFLVVPETFDLRDFDLVISSSGAWSKGIVTKLNTIHIAYIHSPMRFVWDYNERYLKEQGQKKICLLKRFILSYARLWDRLAADRPDYLIANSKYTQERIKKYYRRESTVIYPPAYIDVVARSEAARQSRSNKDSVITPGSLDFARDEEKFFLVVSRLSPYKKVDVAVEAFNKLELPLVVIGEGKQEKYLKLIARGNIQILGWQNDETVERYYSGARAFIFPAEDDFGITMVEAMSHGIPVIAYGKGGAIEIVQEAVTGEFFHAQTPEVLADGVRRFMEKEKKYDKEKIRKKAEEFSKEKFKKEFREFVNHITYNV
ncbi:MAG: glycosyltransferase [Candidatus Moranbacteria bacterium]|nr:glycosyltransferase [Candidatus Moranbacteria bacterium]